MNWYRMKALSCVLEGNLSMQYCLGPYQYPSSRRWYTRTGVDRMKEPGQAKMFQFVMLGKYRLLSQYIVWFVVY